MATIYIDPSATNNGDGTTYTQAASGGAAGAKNTWSGLTYTAGNSYLQRAGTTYTTQITVNAGGTVNSRMTFGSYDASNGAVTTTKAKLAGAARYGINFLVDIGFTTVQDFDISAIGDGTNSNFGVTCITTASNPATAIGVIVQRCDIHDLVNSAAQDVDGVHLIGADCKVLNCRFWNIPTDAIWTSGHNHDIGFNTVLTINRDGRNLADCIQVSLSNYPWIHDNTLDGSAGSGKQVIICQGTTGALIERNTCIGGLGVQQNIYCDQAGAVIRANLCVNGLLAVRLNAVGTVEGNVHYCTYPPSFGIWLEVAGATARQNTILWVGSAVGGLSGTGSGIYQDAAEVSTVQYNIISGCGWGIRLDEGVATESYNNIFNCTIPVKGVVSNPALGTGTITTDPQLRGDYMPLATAVRSIGAATGRGDFYGKEFRGTIGAVQYQPVRTVTSRLLAPGRAVTAT
jgi:hypothetical protein